MDKRQEPLLWFIVVPLVISVAGGIAGVKYQEGRTPHSAVTADGYCATYSKEPLKDNPWIPDSRYFCSLTIVNAGSRRAEAVRLSVPALQVAVVGGRTIGGWGLPLPGGTVDLGTIEAFDQVSVSTWSLMTKPERPALMLSHSEGPGEIKLRTVPDKYYFFQIIFTDPSSILVGFFYISIPVIILALILSSWWLSRNAVDKTKPS